MSKYRNKKFKVWDKENKEWFKPIYEGYNNRIFEILISLKGDLIIRNEGFEINGHKGRNIHESCFPNRFELIEYTGLKDKNGKEIYEGDVIKQTYHKTIGYGDNEENFKGYHIGEVVLISSGVCIKKPLMYEAEIDQLVKLDGYKNVAGYRSEVIGNIYENPELLEGN